MEAAASAARDERAARARAAVLETQTRCARALVAAKVRETRAADARAKAQMERYYEWTRGRRAALVRAWAENEVNRRAEANRREAERAERDASDKKRVAERDALRASSEALRAQVARDVEALEREIQRVGELATSEAEKLRAWGDETPSGTTTRADPTRRGRGAQSGGGGEPARPRRSGTPRERRRVGGAGARAVRRPRGVRRAAASIRGTWRRCTRAPRRASSSRRRRFRSRRRRRRRARRSRRRSRGTRRAGISRRRGSRRRARRRRSRRRSRGTRFARRCSGRRGRARRSPRDATVGTTDCYSRRAFIFFQNRGGVSEDRRRLERIQRASSETSLTRSPHGRLVQPQFVYEIVQFFAHGHFIRRRVDEAHVVLIMAMCAAHLSLAASMPTSRSAGTPPSAPSSLAVVQRLDAPRDDVRALRADERRRHTACARPRAAAARRCRACASMTGSPRRETAGTRVSARDGHLLHVLAQLDPGLPVDLHELVRAPQRGLAQRERREFVPIPNAVMAWPCCASECSTSSWMSLRRRFGARRTPREPRPQRRLRVLEHLPRLEAQVTQVAAVQTRPDGFVPARFQRQGDR